jgi:hypothetical protein
MRGVYRQAKKQARYDKDVFQGLKINLIYEEKSEVVSSFIFGIFYLLNGFKTLVFGFLFAYFCID